MQYNECFIVHISTEIKDTLTRSKNLPLCYYTQLGLFPFIFFDQWIIIVTVVDDRQIIKRIVTNKIKKPLIKAIIYVYFDFFCAKDRRGKNRVGKTARSRPS